MSPAQSSPRTRRVVVLGRVAKGFLAGSLLVAAASLCPAQQDYSSAYSFTTVAGGNGADRSDGVCLTADFSGEGAARCAVRSDGSIFVTNNNEILKVTPAGVASRYAGMPGEYGAIAGGVAVPTYADGTAIGQARFNRPMGIAFDGSGNLYVADASNYLIRRVSADGTVSPWPTSSADIAG